MLNFEAFPVQGRKASSIIDLPQRMLIEAGIPWFAPEVAVALARMSVILPSLSNGHMGAIRLHRAGICKAAG